MTKQPNPPETSGLFVAGMREYEKSQHLCWRIILNGERACIQDRGHDGGVHEGTAEPKETSGHPDVIICDCGNVISAYCCDGTHPVKEVRKHPACGRPPNEGGTPKETSGERTTAAFKALDFIEAVHGGRWEHVTFAYWRQRIQVVRDALTASEREVGRWRGERDAFAITMAAEQRRATAAEERERGLREALLNLWAITEVAVFEIEGLLSSDIEAHRAEAQEAVPAIRKRRDEARALLGIDEEQHTRTDTKELTTEEKA